MQIQGISTRNLRRLKYPDGFVIQGCSGDLAECAESIEKMLTERKILSDGEKFDYVYVFENRGRTNLFFPTRNVVFDIRSLGAWRVTFSKVYGAMWLSDYVNTYLDGSLSREYSCHNKPTLSLVAANAEKLIQDAVTLLWREGYADDADDLIERLKGVKEYDEIKAIVGLFVEKESA